MIKAPLVSVITVNFNNRRITGELIRSLLSITYPNIEIIVVDNGSTEEIDSIKTEFPEVILLKSKKNLGFAGGNNLGIAASGGKYLMFLNNDAEVEAGFLEPLVELFEKNPGIGMASPKIKYFDSPGRNTIQFAGSTEINLLTIRGKTFGDNEKDRGQYDRIYETQLAHGAAMMVPTATVLKAGLMPDIYFLYYEEHDWCQRIKRAGYKVYFVGLSNIFHKESITVGADSPLKIYYLNRGRIIYLRRNTSGLSKVLSLAYFMLLAFPKNIISLFLRGPRQSVKAFLMACLWNLKTPNVSKTPYLVQQPDGEKEIKDSTLQELKMF